MQVSHESKSKLTHNQNGQKMCCNANKDIAQLIAIQRQRKPKIAAKLVFVCTCH